MSGVDRLRPPSRRCVLLLVPFSLPKSTSSLIALVFVCDDGGRESLPFRLPE
jgi:hypothetical protein